MAPLEELREWQDAHQHVVELVRNGRRKLSETRETLLPFAFAVHDLHETSDSMNHTRRPFHDPAAVDAKHALRAVRSTKANLEIERLAFGGSRSGCVHERLAIARTKHH